VVQAEQAKTTQRMTVKSLWEKVTVTFSGDRQTTEGPLP
jgi:hypothetical protein